jgi:hypothetical protein
MSFKVSIKNLALAGIGILFVADGIFNVFIGSGSANKTLAVPEVPSALMGGVTTSSSFDPDAIDGLFGLSAVVSAREQARAQQAELDKEAELVAQEPEQTEQVLVIGEDQFRLFGVSSVGVQQYAIFSIDNSGENSDLLELELGASLELLDGLALLRLERVGVQSVSLLISYVESEEQVRVDLALFKGVE